MTGLTPTDLAKYIHPVPVGATIPACMPHVWRYEGQRFALVDDFADYKVTSLMVPRWTAEPIAPKPPLPTEPGSVIVDVVTVAGGRYNVGVLTPAGRGSWMLIDTERDDYEWVEPSHITTFTAARIVTEAGDECREATEKREATA